MENTFNSNDNKLYDSINSLINNFLEANSFYYSELYDDRKGKGKINKALYKYMDDNASHLSEVYNKRINDTDIDRDAIIESKDSSKYDQLNRIDDIEILETLKDFINKMPRETKNLIPFCNRKNLNDADSNSINDGDLKNLIDSYERMRCNESEQYVRNNLYKFGSIMINNTFINILSGYLECSIRTSISGRNEITAPCGVLYYNYERYYNFIMSFIYAGNDFESINRTILNVLAFKDFFIPLEKKLCALNTAYTDSSFDLNGIIADAVVAIKNDYKTLLNPKFVIDNYYRNVRYMSKGKGYDTNCDQLFFDLLETTMDTAVYDLEYLTDRNNIYDLLIKKNDKGIVKCVSYPRGIANIFIDSVIFLGTWKIILNAIK